MEVLMQWLPMLAILVGSGIVAGVMAGLLGVGGGIVIVPVLESALAMMGVDPAVRMHIAVATSLAIIVPTSLSSARAHHARGSIDITIVRAWGLFILVGSVMGTWLASRMDSGVLTLMFGCVAILVAVKLALPMDGYHVQGISWHSGPLRIVPLLIGGLSSMIGIGGGSFSVPSLTLLGVDMRRAVGTSALFGLLISLPGALAYVVSGWQDPRMPDGNIGYVSLVGLVCIAPTTVLAAPLGVKLAHRLSQRTLSVVFAVFLLSVGGRMLLRGLS
ncbi:MAG: sulfite exporter TauE/SafE family protein [Parahaliea sp.]